MQLTDRRIGNAVVLAASGRIDHASAERFKAALQPFLEPCQAGGDVVVLDFSAVEYISSVGLRVLMLAAKQTKSQQGAIAVAALQPVVKEIFEDAAPAHDPFAKAAAPDYSGPVDSWQIGGVGVALVIKLGRKVSYDRAGGRNRIGFTILLQRAGG